MTQPSASRAGSFKIGDSVEINRLGFGAMRITGKGIWGPPKDREEALRVLRRLPDLGVNFIDTADSYGPEVSETLIHEALHPYQRILVATKAGMTRSGPAQWHPVGRPEYLRQQALMSLRRLGVERIGLWQLHRIDRKVPRDEQFGAIKALIDDGIINQAGLSEVSVADIEEASKYFPVATVQNRYNVLDRESEDVLDYCEQHNIGFIPWFPLASGKLPEGSALEKVAGAHDATVRQIALAWLLARSPVMLPIPGTSKASHLEENVAAAGIELSSDDMDALNGVAAAA